MVTASESTRALGPRRPSPVDLAIAYESERRTVNQIAKRRGLNPSVVADAIEAVRRWADTPVAPPGPLPRLIPMFGITPFIPFALCDHRPDYFALKVPEPKPGEDPATVKAIDPDNVTRFVCCRCHRSAWDAHGSLRLGVLPPPEPRAPRTRKAKRAVGFPAWYRELQMQERRQKRTA